MNNVVIISTNTLVSPVEVRIGKPEEILAPTTREEAKAMIIADIDSTLEALIHMVDTAHNNKYGDKNEIFKMIKDRIILESNPNLHEQPTNNEHPEPIENPS